MPQLEQQEAGFRPLFNGRTLEGWEVVGDTAGWTVQDGVIDCSGERRAWVRASDGPVAGWMSR
ncbi:MAG: DUF1080 domain-containing protein [Chloroflexi bacterium]|nr:DUF1080 domain-containing protein [Chloroflexota bacterium]